VVERKGKMNCWVLPHECKVDARDIPLEICQTCIKAYIELLKHPLVRRTSKASKGEMVELQGSKESLR
jgi:hypothetical protein